MTISEIQEQIVEEFSMFDSWEERYEYLIELGKSIPLIEASKKTDDNLIRGCQSKVWLDAEMKEGKLYFTADSDAILPKGIAALLMRMFSGQTTEDIMTANTDFIQKIGLQEFLSPTRANGLLAMIKQIKLYAVVFQRKMKSN